MGDGAPREPNVSLPVRVGRKVIDTCVNDPLQYIRDWVIDKQKRNPSKWYHRKFRRVPTIDQCYTDDPVCRFEADEQFLRDRKVDQQVIKILRQRRIECLHFWGPDGPNKCKSVIEDYEQAADNYFIRYGEIAVHFDVVEAYMKQKHRLVWERRQKGLKERNTEANFE